MHDLTCAVVSSGLGFFVKLWELAFVFGPSLHIVYFRLALLGLVLANFIGEFASLKCRVCSI